MPLFVAYDFDDLGPTEITVEFIREHPAHAFQVIRDLCRTVERQRAARDRMAALDAIR